MNLILLEHVAFSNQLLRYIHRIFNISSTNYKRSIALAFLDINIKIQVFINNK